MSINLNKNKYGVYYVRFRVSTKLRKYFNKDYISKSLATKNYRKASSKAMLYRSKYLEILEVSDWLDNETLQIKTNEYLKETLKISQSSKVNLQIKKDLGLTLEEGFSIFDKWYRKQDVSEQQYKIVIKRLQTALNYFKHNSLIKELTTDDIEEYIEFLTSYPNPLKKPYRDMPFEEIQELSNIPHQDIISSSTVIKYIKAFRQLENFLIDEGIIDRRISKRAKLPTANTVNVKPFTKEDLVTLYDEFDKLGELGLIYYTFAYTGMRTSEFWKCRIGYEDNIYYFNLSYKGVKLKTASSRRKIPIHSNLLNMGILDSFKYLQENYTQSLVSNTFNNRIINVIGDTKNKVLYGFRHTLATNLKRHDVDIDKISEILGHSYQKTSMTKTVYTNGYSLKQLKEALEELTLIRKSNNC